jgi:hypothetical protein
MQDWKVRQEVYHRLNQSHGDDLKDKQLVFVHGQEIVDNAVKYFTKDPGWIYPSKSFVVAICYAKWLSKEFAENFWEVLDDPELLYNNDPYFVPYKYSKMSKEIYDAIINSVGLGFDETQGVIPDIRNYFKDEFMLND